MSTSPKTNLKTGNALHSDFYTPPQSVDLDDQYLLIVPVLLDVVMLVVEHHELVVPELLDVRVLDVLVHVAEEGVHFVFVNVKDPRIVADR